MRSCLLLSFQNDRQIIQKALSANGFSVSWTNNESAAVELVNDEGFDAVLIESKLPKDFGWDFCERMLASGIVPEKTRLFVLCEGPGPEYMPRRKLHERIGFLFR